MAAAKPAAAPAGEFQEESEKLLRLQRVFVGRRVLLDGYGGVVESVEPHLDYRFLFNIAFNNGLHCQLERHELDAALADAAEQVRPQPRVHTAANAAQH